MDQFDERGAWQKEFAPKGRRKEVSLTAEQVREAEAIYTVLLTEKKKSLSSHDAGMSMMTDFESDSLRIKKMLEAEPDNKQLLVSLGQLGHMFGLARQLRIDSPMFDFPENCLDSWDVAGKELSAAEALRAGDEQLYEKIVSELTEDFLQKQAY